VTTDITALELPAGSKCVTGVMCAKRPLLEKLGLLTPEFSGVYKADNGQTYEMFNLPKDLTLTLVSGYDIVLRYRNEDYLSFVRPNNKSI